APPRRDSPPAESGRLGAPRCPARDGHAAPRGILMSPSLSPRLPSDPTCAICSKPIVGGYLQTEAGEVYHIRCRTQRLHLTALDQTDRARLAVERAKSLVEENARLRSEGVPFTLAGRVRSWDPKTRTLWVRHHRMIVRPDVRVPALKADDSITVSGYLREGSASWLVMSVRKEPA